MFPKFGSIGTVSYVAWSRHERGTRFVVVQVCLSLCSNQLVFSSQCLSALCLFLFISIHIKSRVIFKCKLINSDIIVDMRVKWVKNSPYLLFAEMKTGSCSMKVWAGEDSFHISPHTPLFRFFSKQTKEVKQERRTTRISLWTSPPKSPQWFFLLLMCETRVAFLHWPWSTVSCAYGKCISPLGFLNDVIVLCPETNGLLHCFILWSFSECFVLIAPTLE